MLGVSALKRAPALAPLLDLALALPLAHVSVGPLPLPLGSEMAPALVTLLDLAFAECRENKIIKTNQFYCVETIKNVRKYMILHSTFANRFPDILFEIFFLYLALGENWVGATEQM